MGWVVIDQKLSQRYSAFQTFSSNKVLLVIEDGGCGTPWRLEAEPQVAFLPQVQNVYERFLTYPCCIFRNSCIFCILFYYLWIFFLTWKYFLFTHLIFKQLDVAGTCFLYLLASSTFWSAPMPKSGKYGIGLWYNMAHSSFLRFGDCLLRSIMSWNWGGWAHPVLTNSAVPGRLQSVGGTSLPVHWGLAGESSQKTHRND